MNNTSTCETNVELNSNEPARLCPFQDRRKDGVNDVGCVDSRCMAWGKWEKNGIYSVGCLLIKNGV